MNSRNQWRSDYRRSSSGLDTPELRRSPLKKTNKDNLDEETFDSYSVLFDKGKHNFSTSSDVSLLDRSGSSSFVLTMIDDPTMTRDQSSDSEETFLSAHSSIPSENETEEKSWPSSTDDRNQIRKTEVDDKLSSKIDIDRHSAHRQENGLIDQFAVRDKRQEKTNLSKLDGNLAPSIEPAKKQDPSDDEDDRAFEQFLRDNRTSKDQPSERPRRLCRVKRNSLKDFICDSSSSDDEQTADLHRRVDRFLDEDSLWREPDESYQSDSSEEEQSSETSSSTDDDEVHPTTTQKRKDQVNFLESLSDQVPLHEKHVDAKQYFLGSAFKGKKKRQELAEKLFSTFDRDIFSSKLSSKVNIVWSGRLTATAGHCTTRRSSSTATITLSDKVCDSPERCRDTLIHELCHAAVSLIDGVIEHGHGQLWRQWTRKAERFYPYLPAISVKHTYDINYKFTYRCVQCKYEVHRHSKSLNVETDLCGKCLGKFELIEKANGRTNNDQTPKRTPNRYNLFVKENFHSLKQSQPHLSTPQLMKELSQRYKQKTRQDNQIELPDFDQLKI